MPQPLPRHRPDPDPNKVARILRETGATLPEITAAKWSRADHTDRARLRGIPVAGGATGTSPGTDPLLNVLRDA